MNVLPTMEFSEAANIWLTRHREDIRQRSIEAYQYYIRKLSCVFAGKLLGQITAVDVLDYQQSRKKEVSAGLVNHELNTLHQILEAADLWNPIRRHYRPLKPARWSPPKVMTPEEEARFWTVANSKPEWRVAVCANIIAGNTTAICSELRNIRLQDLFLDHQPPMIHIDDETAKNEFRGRRIPLNAAALAAVMELLERTKNLGAFRPEDYLFPFREARNRWDVTRPAGRSFLRHSFREMRAAAGLPWLQHRHFRNIAITKLFEAGASDETVKSIAGHASIKMSSYYARIRIEAKAEALNSLGSVTMPVNAAGPQAKPKPGNMSAMAEAAKLVKETGIDVQTAIQIVRGFMEETAAKVEDSLDALRRKISRADKPESAKVVSLDGKKVMA